MKQPPGPRGSIPYPSPIFSSLPRPVFFLIFLPGTPAQNSDFLPPPHPSDPAPCPFFVKSPPTPAPLTPGSPVLPHVSNKTSYEILWSLEAMRPWLYNLSHSCRAACHISERSHNSKYKSRGFEKFARSYNETTYQMFQYLTSLVCKF